MNKSAKTSTIRLICGVVLAVLVIGQALSCVSSLTSLFDNFHIGWLISVVASIMWLFSYLFLALSMLINRPRMDVGLYLGLSGNIVNLLFRILFGHIGFGITFPGLVRFVVVEFGAILFWILLIMSFSSRKHTLAFIASCVNLLRALVSILAGDTIAFYAVLLVIFPILFGIYIHSLPRHRRVTQPQSTRKEIVPEESVVIKLSKLKSLLDEGIITQEEFDTKKKQLLEL